MILELSSTVSKKWKNIFKSRPSKICGRQSLKIWGNMACLTRPNQFKFLKGFPSQILLCPFLNTLSQISDLANSCSRRKTYLYCPSMFLLLEPFRVTCSKLTSGVNRALYLLDYKLIEGSNKCFVVRSF